MKRRVAGSILFCCMLVCVLGADTISLNNAIPNPKDQNGMPQPNKLYGDGDYSIDPNNTPKSPPVSFYAQETTTKQTTYNSADINAGKWSKTLDVVPGTYDCWGVVYSISKKGVYNITISNMKRVTVK